jgi:hypothetical protein
VKSAVVKLLTEIQALAHWSSNTVIHFRQIWTGGSFSIAKHMMGTAQNSVLRMYIKKDTVPIKGLGKKCSIQNSTARKQKRAVACSFLPVSSRSRLLRPVSVP